jgi:bacterioferritin
MEQVDLEIPVPNLKLIALLNEAIARELQVSIQYMFQHALGAGRGLIESDNPRSARQRRFIASHVPYVLPGARLKTIAIAEMRHAEAIAERVDALGGEATTQPEKITIDRTSQAMLENNREQERSAIELYRRIIDEATHSSDEATARLFRRILKDEEKHYRVFTDMLGGSSPRPHVP